MFLCVLNLLLKEVCFMTFGSKIKYLLEVQNMTQTELAEKLGCRQSVVSRWIKTNSNNPKMSTMQKLSEIFNVPINYFFDAFAEKIQTHFDTSGNEIKNNSVADIKDLQLQLKDHEIRLLKIENEMLKKNREK